MSIPDSAGGAIFAGGHSNVTISSSLFQNNQNSQSIGGAVTAIGGSDISIEDSSFIGNSAKQGGAIGSSSSTISLMSTVLTGNSAGTTGLHSSFHNQTAGMFISLPPAYTSKQANNRTASYCPLQSQQHWVCLSRTLTSSQQQYSELACFEPHANENCLIGFSRLSRPAVLSAQYAGMCALLILWNTKQKNSIYSLAQLPADWDMTDQVSLHQC